MRDPLHNRFSRLRAIRSGLGILLLAFFSCGCDTPGSAGESVILTDGSGKPVRYAGNFSAAKVEIPVAPPPRTAEMRGIWVATVDNGDFAKTPDSAAFTKAARALCKEAASAGFNALLFQVRPMNDAFYPSKLNPWSRYLTGKEGQAPAGEKGFDPLAFLVAEAHRKGLQFHAWLNPYRVAKSTGKKSKSAYLKTLASGNFARRHPEWVLAIPKGDGDLQLVLDPGRPEVRQFIRHTVLEIARNYPVDAIHFDDYFYPEKIAGEDAATFKAFNPDRLPLEEWRRRNVNFVVKGVHDDLAALSGRKGRRIEFGISPRGIWANASAMKGGSPTGGSQSYFKQYADTRRWIRSGWLDYVAPQLYWNFAHPTAAYACLADWWADTVRGTGVRLYVGMGAYRIGESGWSKDELHRQLLYNRKRPEIQGEIFFSWRNYARPANAAMRKGFPEMLKRHWKTPLPCPSGTP